MRMEHFEIYILKLITRLISFLSFFLSFSLSLLFFVHLPTSNLGLTRLGTYNPNARGSDACRGSNSLWTRTLDRYKRAGLPECVVSTMSGPPPETTQDRTQRTHTQFLTPPGSEPEPSGWKPGTLPITPRRRIIY